MKPDKTDPGYEELLHKAEIIIGKQRNGPVGDLELVFISEFATFMNKAHHPRIEIPAGASSEMGEPF